MNIIIELYKYREMIVSLVKRDLIGRYKGSVLGFFWTFLNPLMQLGVYTIVFSVIMRGGIEDYYLFLFVALVPWIFFSTSISGGSACIWEQQDMVKKIYFPREVLPLSYVASQFFNMLFSFIVVIAVVLLSGREINFVAFLYLPFVMLVEFFLALSFAMVVSGSSVYLRDLQYFLPNVMMVWQFITPVMYPIEQVPDNLRWIFNINPMSPIIIAYRNILYDGKVPKVETLLQASIMGIVILVVGTFIFSRLKRRFAEVM